MGRFISYGIATEYYFDKKIIKDKFRYKFDKPSEEEIRHALINTFSSDIYDFYENDDLYFFGLKDEISMQDIVELMKKYWEIRGASQRVQDDLEEIYNEIAEMSIEEALNYAKNCSMCYFSYLNLERIFPPLFYPVKLNGKKHFLYASAVGFHIDMASSKTDTEDEAESYDFFTDLLRYRLKPLKLADTMLVYLSR